MKLYICPIPINILKVFLYCKHCLFGENVKLLSYQDRNFCQNYWLFLRLVLTSPFCWCSTLKKINMYRSEENKKGHIGYIPRKLCPISSFTKKYIFLATYVFKKRICKSNICNKQLLTSKLYIYLRELLENKSSFNLDFVQNRSDLPSPGFLDFSGFLGTLFRKSKFLELLVHFCAS